MQNQSAQDSRERLQIRLRTARTPSYLSQWASKPNSALVRGLSQASLAHEIVRILRNWRTSRDLRVRAQLTWPLFLYFQKVKDGIGLALVSRTAAYVTHGDRTRKGRPKSDAHTGSGKKTSPRQPGECEANSADYQTWHDGLLQR